MNWITGFSEVTTILLLGDTAGFLIARLVFSERVRRWVRIGQPRPAATAVLPDRAVPAAIADGASIKTIRSLGLVRNPFDPRTREREDDMPARKRSAHASRRPTFRRSIVLQQRVARYERITGRGEISLEPHDGAAGADSQIRFRLLDQSFEPLAFRRI
ncbi:MAG TPA: hypothetical protein VKT99_04985 [Xanthobacteraceae bacterium]|nr:hypothetical protein [Xanthobacteraceae bacterium]HZT36687.1 hypothetical protein [Bryobacteraceae bacterium]